MSLYKHCVSMAVVRREITEVHPDHVIVTEYMVPDPEGPFLVMSGESPAQWAARKVKEPVTTDHPAAARVHPMTCNCERCRATDQQEDAQK